MIVVQLAAEMIGVVVGGAKIKSTKKLRGTRAFYGMVFQYIILAVAELVCEICFESKALLNVCRGCP